MNAGDSLAFASQALSGNRLRTALILLAMAIGVASVIVLNSLGDAARRYVIGEFSALGTHLIIVLPGRSETAGASPSMFLGETTRDLTIADAMSLTRLPGVRRVAPINVGATPVSRQGRSRDIILLGTTLPFLAIRGFHMEKGRFLPETSADQATAVCVIGKQVKRELFGSAPALGEWLRIADRRFRVIGILASEGTSLGQDTNELVIIPVASAQAIFNTQSLFRILIDMRAQEQIPKAITAIEDRIRVRHQGDLDVTVVTQDAVISTFNNILGALTLAVTGIAGISLIVAGVLVMNVMLVSVSQRTAEIGVLKAIGATKAQILRLFLMESALLAILGAVLGLIIGYAGNQAITHWFPQLSMTAPWWSQLAAIVVAVLTGLLFGILPARKAARLDPITSLQRR